MAVETLRREAAAELRRFLDEEGAGFPAIDLVWQVLRARGKLLSGGTGFCWGLLPLLVCEAAGGAPTRALPLSSAAECFIAAADTFDDLQDQDDEDGLWNTAGVATASNVAAFLLFLTQLALGRLARSAVSEERVLRIAQEFAAAGARACGGQQRDLDQRNPWEVDEAWYLETVGAKSAALVECLCRSGAIIAGADAVEVQSFARFGFNLGVALQIGNDVVAASREGSKRNDLRLGKPTLPLLFALQGGPQFIRGELSGIIRPDRTDDLQPEEVARVRALLVKGGAIEYGKLMADVFWEKTLAAIEKVQPTRRQALLEMVEGMRQT